MNQVLRADEFTGLVEGQITLVDMGIVTLDHILRWVRHHFTIGIDIERHTLGICCLNQIVNLRNRTNTKRNIVEAETRSALLMVESYQ